MKGSTFVPRGNENYPEKDLVKMCQAVGRTITEDMVDRLTALRGVTVEIDDVVGKLAVRKFYTGEVTWWLYRDADMGHVISEGPHGTCNFITGEDDIRDDPFPMHLIRKI